MADQTLQGKVAIVTGAARGMGRAMSLALLRAGARVTMTDVADEELQVAANLGREAAGDDAVLALRGDVTDPESADILVRRTISELGGLHILINDAGLGMYTIRPDFRTNPIKFWEVTPEQWNRILSVNGTGPFHMARAAAPHLVEQGWGRIIGVTTSLDTMMHAGQSAYGPTKALHEAFIAIMAKELEGTGVTANVLVPGGPVNTRFIPEEVVSDREVLIQPEVMMTPVAWLASEASSDLTGQRFIARNWDASLPPEKAAEAACAPAGWAQLGVQAQRPWE